MIAKRTLGWLIALLLLGSAMAWRIHWEKTTATEYKLQHAHHSDSDRAAPTNGDAIGFVPMNDGVGELEPWWAKLIILGAFAALIGTITLFSIDLWHWIRRQKVRV